MLHGIDLHVPAGGCVALVGKSGGGKSTLAKLVGRFYDPGEGAVRVDGNDLREIDLAHYRRQLGVVLQDPFLFAGTIADNIRFAAPRGDRRARSRTSRARSGSTASRARFYEGLDHAVREGGAGLSAGERQLISIARALLADPRILILDEATSNIDRPTEVLIERRSTACCTAAPRSSSPTGSRPSGAPTRSWCSTTAGSRRAADSTSLLAIDGPFLAKDLVARIATGCAEPR